MKRVLLILISLSAVQSVYAQYQPIAVEGAQWIQFYLYDGVPQHQNFFVAGDSTVRGESYKRVYRRRLSNAATTYDELVPPYLIDSPAELVGLLRDDTTARRVYGWQNYIPAGCDSAAVLLYDFTRSPGDTLSDCYNRVYETAIDSANTTIWAGTARYTFYADFYQKSIRFVEGIGGDYGPFTTLESPPVIPGNFDIRLVDYCIGTDVECGLEPTATQNAADALGLSIYPNPTDGETLFVDAQIDCSEDLEATFYDALGRPVWRSVNLSCTAFPLSIPTANLPAGAYHVSLRGSFGVATRRVVVR